MVRKVRTTVVGLVVVALAANMGAGVSVGMPGLTVAAWAANVVAVTPVGKVVSAVPWAAAMVAVEIMMGEEWREGRDKVGVPEIVEILALEEVVMEASLGTVKASVAVAMVLEMSMAVSVARAEVVGGLVAEAARLQVEAVRGLVAVIGVAGRVAMAVTRGTRGAEKWGVAPAAAATLVGVPVMTVVPVACSWVVQEDAPETVMVALAAAAAKKVVEARQAVRLVAAAAAHEEGLPVVMKEPNEVGRKESATAVEATVLR